VGGTFAGLTFEVGDWIISNGTAWEKVNNTDAVRTVFGRLGDVVANAGDYSAFYVTLDTAQTITATKTFNNSGSASNIIVNHTSGSGIALDITKAGNGEGIRVNKTSGSGNAVTITGGNLSAEAATLSGILSGTSAFFSNSVTVTADLGGAVLNLRGRSVDNLSNLLFFSNIGSTLQNYIQSSPSSLGINSQGNTPITFGTNLSGGGGTRMTISGAGAVTFTSSITASSIIRTGGTSVQFLKADGSIDINTYVTTNTTQSITGAKTFNESTLNIAESGASGISQFNNFSSDWGYSATANRIGFNGSKNFFIANQNGNGGVFTFSNPASVVSYAFPPTSGTIALTSDIPADNVTGTGAAGQVSFWTGANTQSGDSGFTWDIVERKMGIGTDSPNSKLEVAGNVAIGYTSVAPTNGLIVAGNVGIGTSTPDSFFSSARNLVVGTGTGNNGMSIFSGSSGVGDIAFADGTTDPAFYSGLIRYDHSLDAMRFFTSSSEKWRITSTGILQSNGAQTIQTSTGNLTLATAGGNGHILLSPNGTGNVGIGLSSPSVKLEVAGNIRSNAGNNQGFILNSGLSIYRVDGSQLGLFTNFIERMRITSDGDVGIGTDDPSDKLEIGGAGAGIILASPDGTRYRVTVTDLGVLTVAAV
jgi:hypothetical protein